jgi:hypothetical protein
VTSGPASDDRRHRAFCNAFHAAGTAFGSRHHCTFPAAGGVECKQPGGAGGHAAAAAGAAVRSDLRRLAGGDHKRGLEGEFELRPGAALDLRAGVIAGAGGNDRRGLLLAGPAAGEAELVGFRLLHGHLTGKQGEGAIIDRPFYYASFLSQPNASSIRPYWMPVRVS